MAEMAEFLRVKLLAYEAGSESCIASNGPGAEYVAVKILEASKTGIEYIFIFPTFSSSTT